MSGRTPAKVGGTHSANIAFGVLLASAFTMLLNETILSLGLRSLADDLHVSVTTVQWLTSGFLLTMAVVIPTTGFLLDRFTVRQVFLTSSGLFCAGTLICALAPGFPVLLLGRVVQGFGTAMIIPLAMTTAMRMAAPDKRGAMMGAFSLVIAFAPALGPTSGGVILAHLSWRWMFLAVLPLGLAAMVMGAATVRVPSETRRVRLDPLSVLLSAMAFGGLLYGFSALGRSDQSLFSAWVPIVVGAVALIVFARRQRYLQRDERALLDLRPFTQPMFRNGALLVFLLFMVYLGVGSVLLPLYVQAVLGQGTLITGLMVLPGGLVLGALARPVGRLFDRHGARPLVLSGAIAMTLALALFASLGDRAPLAAVVGIHILMMVGIGLMTTPLMTVPLVALPGALYGHGSAILSTLTQLAGAVGTTVFVTAATLGADNPAGAPDARGMQIAFVAAGCAGVLAVIGAVLMRQPEATVNKSQAVPQGTTAVEEVRRDPAVVDLQASNPDDAEGATT